MIKPIAVCTLMVLISGCATHTSNRIRQQQGCPYPERDLSVAWQSRSYWCLPKAYQPAPIDLAPNVLPNGTLLQATAQSRSVAETTTAAPIFLHEVPTPAVPETLRVKQVGFIQHDTDYQYSDIETAITNFAGVKRLRLTGCRIESEPERFILGRSLSVRHALVGGGYTGKITILANHQCTSGRYVRIES